MHPDATNNDQETPLQHNNHRKNRHGHSFTPQVQCVYCERWFADQEAVELHMTMECETYLHIIGDSMDIPPSSTSSDASSNAEGIHNMHISAASNNKDNTDTQPERNESSSMPYIN